jgi:hypothetical protein
VPGRVTARTRCLRPTQRVRRRRCGSACRRSCRTGRDPRCSPPLHPLHPGEDVSAGAAGGSWSSRFAVGCLSRGVNGACGGMPMRHGRAGSRRSSLLLTRGLSGPPSRGEDSGRPCMPRRGPKRALGAPPAHLLDDRRGATVRASGHSLQVASSGRPVPGGGGRAEEPHARRTGRRDAHWSGVTADHHSRGVGHGGKSAVARAGTGRNQAIPRQRHARSPSLVRMVLLDAGESIRALSEPAELAVHV